jgi:Zn-dependent alcohol dehydrogenase
VPAGSTVVVIGLGGVGLSVVMGAALAGASRIVAVDRVPTKLERAREVGATHGVVAKDRSTTDAAIRQAAGDAPDFVFEAIGLPATIEEAIELLPPGGSILGSNYGSTVASVDFPRLAELHLAGRLPIDRLIDHRIGLDDLEAAFERMRRGDGVRSVIVFGSSRAT